MLNDQSLWHMHKRNGQCRHLLLGVLELDWEAETSDSEGYNRHSRVVTDIKNGSMLPDGRLPEMESNGWLRRG